MSRWTVAPAGCKAGVKQLVLKGTRAVRCRPPRGEAWLRGSMVSPNEAGFNLRETFPLSRNNLHTPEVTARVGRDSERVRGQVTYPNDYRGLAPRGASHTVSAAHLLYAADVRDSAKSGLG